MSEHEGQEFEVPVVSQEVKDLAAKTLLEIRNRSFSGRNPELGKMIKCPVCQTRHRAAKKCEQKFVELFVEEDLETGEKTVVYAVAAQPKDYEISSQISAQQPTMKQVLGAATFKGKRRHSHPNKRGLQFIQLVRSFTPDEYTEADLEKAKKKARRILSKKFGRYRFLPSLSESKQAKKLEEKI